MMNSMELITNNIRYYLIWDIQLHWLLLGKFTPRLLLGLVCWMGLLYWKNFIYRSSFEEGVKSFQEGHITMLIGSGIVLWLYQICWLVRMNVITEVLSMTIHGSPWLSGMDCWFLFFCKCVWSCINVYDYLW